MEQEIATFQTELASARSIAMARIRWLDDSALGLPVEIHRLLKQAINAFVEAALQDDVDLVSHASTRNLYDCLQIHLQCSKLDPCLGVELGAQGTHVQLRRVIQFHTHVDNRELMEADMDAVMELQDVACEIAALYSNFPMKVSPFARDALVERLPLTFTVREVLVADSKSKDESSAATNKIAEEQVLIHQVTTRQSAQEDVGFVMWPSAVVLSRWLLSNPAVLSQVSSVLEIGAGCGLVGLLAARLMRKQQQLLLLQLQSTDQTCEVLLSDFNRTVLDNLEGNIALNEVMDLCQTVGLDFYQQSGTSHNGWIDMQGHVRAPVDVVLAADMICQPADAVCAANTVHDALRSGGRAYVVCADTAHRYGVDHFAKECVRVGLQVEAQSVADLNSDLLHGTDMEKTAGFVKGMNLTMFFIEKPNQ